MPDFSTDSVPTAAPNAEYHESLKDWYKSIGKGDRYNKAKVQQMQWFWPKVKLAVDGATVEDPASVPAAQFKTKFATTTHTHGTIN